MNDKQSGIYAILHRESGIAYVGQSKNVAARWGRHRLDLKRNSHASPRLQRAWTKYGAESFDFVVLERVGADRDALCIAEQRWIDSFAAGAGVFNLAPVAGSLLGFKNSPETIALKTAAQNRPEVNARRGASLRAAWGTDLMRAAQSERAKQYWQSTDRSAMGAKISAAKSTPEARAAASQKMKAYLLSPEARAQRSEKQRSYKQRMREEAAV